MKGTFTTLLPRSPRDIWYVIPEGINLTHPGLNFIQFIWKKHLKEYGIFSGCLYGETCIKFGMHSIKGHDWQKIQIVTTEQLYNADALMGT